MVSDTIDFNLTRPSHPSYYDRNMEFAKDRQFWLVIKYIIFLYINLIQGLLLLGMGWVYVRNRFETEQLRWFRWDRMENLKDKPAHHFSNRGGVLFEKRFVGFEKYYRNGKDQEEWYKRAYGAQFKP